MPITYITRRERFSAAHRLFVEGYSDEKNNDIYGICSRPNMHGHNYELFVTIRGEVNRSEERRVGKGGRSRWSRYH